MNDNRRSQLRNKIIEYMSEYCNRNMPPSAWEVHEWAEEFGYGKQTCTRNYMNEGSPLLPLWNALQDELKAMIDDGTIVVTERIMNEYNLA